MKVKGSDLKKAVRASGISPKAIAEKLEIAESTFYSLYHKEEVEEHYLKSIEKAGVKLQITTEQTPGLEVYLGIINTLQKSIEMMDRELISKERDLNIYRTIVEAAGISNIIVTYNLLTKEIQFRSFKGVVHCSYS